MKIFILIAEQSSCSYYRAVLPAIHTAAALASHGISIRASNKLDEREYYNVYMFGRVPTAAEYMFAMNVHERGAKIVWDLDDDFFTIPDWSPVKDLFGPVPLNYLEKSIRMASAITVSTRHLAETTRLRWSNHPVHVLENLVDIRTYINISSKCDLTRILWTGSNTHVGDIDPPLLAIADFVIKNPMYLLIVYGFIPDILLNIPRIIHVPWGAKRNYESILSMINPDIALLPLSDCEFNRCKSAIKFFECTMAGAMCLASNVPPFSDVIQDQVTGLLLPHDDPEAWIAEISAVRSPETSEHVDEIKTNARREVISEFSWNSQNARVRAWVEFFLSLQSI